MRGRKNICTLTRLHTCTLTRLHALTLIELVIVCAIIAVLVGIVWVVMAPAREKARQVHCINNLRQIHYAFMLYRDDYGASAEPELGIPRDPAELGLPCVSIRRSSSDILPDLHEQLTPYVPSKDVWRCLNDPTPPEDIPEKTISYVRTFDHYACWHEEVINLPRSHIGWWFMDRFRRMTATCGDRMPLMFCPWHGLNQRTDSYAIIMRWNGEVKGQYISFTPDNLCLD